MAEACRDVASVSMGNVRRCSGEKKVKIPVRWRIEFPATLQFGVYDAENGSRYVFVRTGKPWAIRGRIERQLKQRGIPVC